MQKKEQEVYFALQCKHSEDNTFVAKKFFFQEWASKRFFDLHVSCRPGRGQQTSIFLSLAGLDKKILGWA